MNIHENSSSTLYTCIYMQLLLHVHVYTCTCTLCMHIICASLKHACSHTCVMYNATIHTYTGTFCSMRTKIRMYCMYIHCMCIVTYMYIMYIYMYIRRYISNVKHFSQYAGTFTIFGDVSKGAIKGNHTCTVCDIMI